MKLISYTETAGRFSQTIATNMSILEFAKYARLNIGNIAITFVHDITPTDFQRWHAEGHPTLLRERK